MKYVKNNKIFSYNDIVKEFPNTSIPLNKDLPSLGYYLLKLTPMPIKEGYRAIELSPINNTQRWELVKIPEVENMEIIEIIESVPQSISPAQARLILLKENLLDKIEKAIANSEEQKIMWDYATSIDRNNPLISYIGETLGLTEEQIDDMFIRASKL